MGESISAGLVRLTDIDFHPFNVGRNLGDLRALADSIARRGLIQPIVVERRGERLRLRAGHRRVAAARMAGLARVPAIIHPAALDDAGWLTHMVEENTHRKALEAEERRDIVAHLRQLGVPWQGIADTFGVGIPTARGWLLTPAPAVVAAERRALPETPPAGAGEHGAPRLHRAPVGRRPPAVVSIRKVADALDDLRTRAVAGVVTVDECIAAIQLVLDLTRGTAAVAADESEPTA